MDLPIDHPDMSDAETMFHVDVVESTTYLETGGLGDVIGLTSAAMKMGEPKVQMDSAMAMALCVLADEALRRRKVN